MGGHVNGDKKIQSSELFEEVAFNREDQLHVYAKLKEKSDGRSVIGNKKKIFIPAVIVLMMVGAAIYMPSHPVLALAKLPFFESIFQFLGDGGLKGAATEDKQDIQQQQSEDGINMEILEAVYDGKRLSISYVIKTENPIKNYTSRQVNAYIPFAGFQKGKIVSNDQFKKVSDYEVIGYSTFTYTASEMPDNINVDFLYRGTTDYYAAMQKDFKFLFKFPVKKTTEIDTIVLNKQQTFEEEELTLKQISLSPISTGINLEYKAPYENDWYNEGVSIRLLDQDDKVIKEIPTGGPGWFGTQIKQNDHWYTLREFNLLFEQLDKETKEIKIQLIKAKNTEDPADMQINFIDMDNAKNQVLNLGERGTMKITDIKQVEDSAVIKYEYKSSFAFYQNFSPLVLKSAEGNWHQGIELKREYQGNNTYMVEELFLDLPKDKISVRYLQEKAPELIKELEIKVSTDEIR